MVSIEVQEPPRMVKNGLQDVKAHHGSVNEHTHKNKYYREVVEPVPPTQKIILLFPAIYML